MFLFKSTSSQGFSELPVLLRSLLLSGISSNTDFCDDDENQLEDYIGIIFPRLVCSFNTWAKPNNLGLVRIAAVFDCIGSKYLVVEFTNVYIWILTGADRDDFGFDFGFSFLSENDLEDQFEGIDDIDIDCKQIYLLARCIIYRKCDDIFTCDNKYQCCETIDICDEAEDCLGSYDCSIFHKCDDEDDCCVPIPECQEVGDCDGVSCP